MDEAKLLEEFQPYIWASVHRTFRDNDEDKEDIAQDLNIVILNAIRKYDPTRKVPIGPYLSLNLRFATREIKRNLMISRGWKRSNNKKLEKKLSFISLGNIKLSYNLNVSELIFLKEKLNPKELNILNMYLAGFSMKEIGKSLNVCESSVCNYIKFMRKYVN